ncbi:RagB/SusD family nutrient uptake outer membrane protein [Hymenobacter polaris]|uniref:RagB/SusD family nutrient uptake outer membrane protein n=1 Tax=Hymenobacter polaris TaxID=2682546 RepID=UPI00293BE847|nr:RagB/SusD family nutrient uptake outer membrane protein [Hymenobacter polaris]
MFAECSARADGAATALTALNKIRARDASLYAGNGGVYMAYASSDFASSDALLKEILTEKYLALIGQIEEFNDVRRTNNLIGVPLNTTTATMLPQRLLYP